MTEDRELKRCRKFYKRYLELCNKFRGLSVSSDNSGRPIVRNDSDCTYYYPETDSRRAPARRKRT